MNPILQQLIEGLIAIVLVTGSLFALIGAWGLARLPDFHTRVQAPTKATTLGVGGVLIASMGINALAGQASAHELLITVFLFITAPISVLMMARAALSQAGHVRPNARRTLQLGVLGDATDSAHVQQLCVQTLQALVDLQPTVCGAIEPYAKFEQCYEFTLSLRCDDASAVTALAAGSWYDADLDGDGSAVWNRGEQGAFLLPEVRWAELFWWR